MKKYKLMRTFVAVTLTSCLLASHVKVEHETAIPKTLEEKEFLEEWNTILEEKIEFKNQELYALLLKEYHVEEITESVLKKISSLRIEKTLENQNFEDLKYLKYLTSLDIRGNTVLGSDLQYNQNLKVLSIRNGTIQHMASLPNSIERLTFAKSTVIDGIILPFHTKNVSLEDVHALSISIKNPSILESFSVKGDTVIDLSIFKDCSSLKDFSLVECSNVRNSSLLKELPIENYVLDDYAAIWLDKDTEENLSYESVNSIKEEVALVDKMAQELGKKVSEVSVSEILSYVENILSLDVLSIKESDVSESLSLYYTKNPIYSAFHGEANALTYSSLAHALALRLNHSSTVLFFDEKYWNVVDGVCYYVSITNGVVSFKEALFPISLYSSYVDKIGYVQEESSWNVSWNGENLPQHAFMYLLILACLEGSLFVLEKKKKRERENIAESKIYKRAEKNSEEPTLKKRNVYYVNGTKDEEQFIPRK